MLLCSKRTFPFPTQPLVLGTLLAALVVVAWRILERVEVGGDSMRPTLLAGDRLLVVRGLGARPGDLVVVDDPDGRRGPLVKRVAAVRGAEVTVLGDNRPASTDSRAFGPVRAVRGRAVYRYHPADRAGRLGRGIPGAVRQAVPCPPMGGPDLGLERLLADDYLDGLEELPMAELRARKNECDEVEISLSYLRRLVQGRLDIVYAELQRRAGGESGGDLSAIVEHLPEILSEGGRSAGAGRLSALIAPDVNYRLLSADLDRIIDIDKVAALTEMDDAQVRRIADALEDLERTVSGRRRALHERMDAFQAEIVRRYKTGEATVDSLLR